MRWLWTASWVVLAACGGETATPTPEGTEVATEGTEATVDADTKAPEPAGAPSAAAFEAVKTEVYGFQPWATAEPILKAKLGEPQSVEGDVHKWYAPEGTACKILTITKMGESVGSVTVEDGPCPP